MARTVLGPFGPSAQQRGVATAIEWQRGRHNVMPVGIVGTLEQAFAAIDAAGATRAAGVRALYE